MAGFASGLAEGLQSGISLAGQQAARDMQMRQEAIRQQNYQSEIAHRTALEANQSATQQRQLATDQYKALGDQWRDLQTLIGQEPDRQKADAYRQQQAQLRQQQSALFPQLAAPQLQGRQDAAALFTSLASGQQTHDKVDTGDLYKSLSQATGFPVERLADPQSPESQAVAYLSGNSGDFAKDHGAKALDAINVLERDKLNAFVGDKMADGSTVTGVQFVAPQPTENGQFVPMLQFTGQTEDGRTATQILPAVASNQNATDPLHVHLANVGDALGRYHQMGALATILQNHPIGRKIADAAEEHGDTVQQQLDAHHLSQANPNQLHAGPQPPAQQGLAPIDFNAPKTTEEDLAAAKARLAPGFKGGYVEERDATGKLVNAVLGPKAEVHYSSRDPEMRNAELGLKAAQTQHAQAETAKLGRDAAKATADSEDPRVGQLMGEMAVRGVQLPGGLRSKDMQLKTLNALLTNNPDASPAEIADQMRDGKINLNAVTRETAQAAAIAGRVSTAINELPEFSQRAIDVSNRIPRGAFVPVNKLLNMSASALSDPNLKELQSYLTSVRNAYDLLSARGGTDAAKREENRKLFDAADSPETLKRALDVLRTEGDIAGKAAAKAMKPGAEQFTINAPSRGLADTAVAPAATAPKAVHWNDLK